MSKKATKIVTIAITGTADFNVIEGETDSDGQLVLYPKNTDANFINFSILKIENDARYNIGKSKRKKYASAIKERGRCKGCGYFTTMCICQRTDNSTFYPGLVD